MGGRTAKFRYQASESAVLTLSFFQNVRIYVLLSFFCILTFPLGGFIRNMNILLGDNLLITPLPPGGALLCIDCQITRISGMLSLLFQPRQTWNVCSLRVNIRIFQLAQTCQTTQLIAQTTQLIKKLKVTTDKPRLIE